MTPCRSAYIQKDETLVTVEMYASSYLSKNYRAERVNIGVV